MSRSEPPPRTAYHKVAAEDFPMVLELIDEGTGEVVWHVEVEGPTAVQVPGFGSRRLLSYLWTPRYEMLHDQDGNTLFYRTAAQRDLALILEASQTEVGREVIAQTLREMGYQVQVPGRGER